MNSLNSVTNFSLNNINLSKGAQTTLSNTKQNQSNLKCYPIEIDSINNVYSNFNKCVEATKKPSGFLSNSKKQSQNFNANSLQKNTNSVKFLPSVYNTSQCKVSKTFDSKRFNTSNEATNNPYEISENFLPKSFATEEKKYSQNYLLFKSNSSKEFDLESINLDKSTNLSSNWKPFIIQKNNNKNFDLLLNNGYQSSPGSNFKSIQKPFGDNNLRANLNKSKEFNLEVSPKSVDWQNTEMRFIDDNNKDGNVLMMERGDSFSLNYKKPLDIPTNLPNKKFIKSNENAFSLSDEKKSTGIIKRILPFSQSYDSSTIKKLDKIEITNKLSNNPSIGKPKFNTNKMFNLEGISTNINIFNEEKNNESFLFDSSSSGFLDDDEFNDSENCLKLSNENTEKSFDER